MSFPDKDVCARIEARLLEPREGEVEHHKYCPMFKDLNSTACFCKELDRADKEAAIEDEYEKEASVD